MKTLSFPPYGTLLFDNDIEEYSCLASISSYKNVELFFDSGKEPIELQLALFAQFLEKYPEKENEYKQYLYIQIKDALPGWNSSEEIDFPNFAKRLQPETIAFDSNGKAEVVYEADGMFTDHTLFVSIDENGIPEDGGI